MCVSLSYDGFAIAKLILKNEKKGSPPDSDITRLFMMLQDLITMHKHLIIKLLDGYKRFGESVQYSLSLRQKSNPFGLLFFIFLIFWTSIQMPIP